MTDAQRLEQIREWMRFDPEYVEVNCHDVTEFLLDQLDAAKQTIAERNEQIQAFIDWQSDAIKQHNEMADEIERLRELIHDQGRFQLNVPTETKDVTIRLSDHSEPKGSR